MPDPSSPQPIGRQAGAATVASRPVSEPPVERAPSAPVAPRRPHETTFHGIVRQDDWFWLREREDPEVRSYLEAENVYTQAIMGPAKGLEDELYCELVARLQETDLSVPERDDEW